MAGESQTWLRDPVSCSHQPGRRLFWPVPGEAEALQAGQDRHFGLGVSQSLDLTGKLPGLGQPGLRLGCLCLLLSSLVGLHSYERKH
jgi:hypothetical protein